MIGVLFILFGVSVIAFILFSVCFSPREQREYGDLDERENYNENMKSAAFWIGADSYQDYDGNKRRL